MKIDLETAMAIIEQADHAQGEYPYNEIDSSVPHDQDWKHLGEDYYVDPTGRFIAGPSIGDPTRTFVVI